MSQPRSHILPGTANCQLNSYQGRHNHYPTNLDKKDLETIGRQYGGIYWLLSIVEY